MKVKSIAWENGSLVIIDQTQLPQKLKYLHCRNEKQVWDAIRKLKVRGAPAIGVAAAFGLVLGLRRKKFSGRESFLKNLDKISAYLASSRPTAVNLVWALDRLRQRARTADSRSAAVLTELMLKEARAILAEDRASCLRMGENARQLVKRNDRIMTYCNAGLLATAGTGTALAVLYEAKKQGKNIKAYACETRPLLQGARLTAWELRQNGIDVTLVCDNMAASLMRQKKIDKIFVGSDRIAANGDAANKIGSYQLAIAAAYHKIPFYVVAPASTFDLKIKTGAAIPIEERPAEEVSTLWYSRPMTAKGVNIYNPAFDVIPAGLIKAIITDHGILRPPYRINIKKCFRK